jgi:hypothetical protein
MTAALRHDYLLTDNLSIIHMSAQATRYSSLRSSPRSRAAPDFGLASLFPADRAPAFFRTEAEKLQALKASLWTAFTAETVEASSPLVELTTAYTGALGLQLDMIDRASVVAKMVPSELVVPVPGGG